MNDINEELVKKLAGLARLALEEELIAPMAESLRGIFNHVESLKQINIDDIEPLTHVHPDSINYRSDQNMEFSKKEAILNSIPDRSGNFIRVPLVIEGES